MSDETTPPPLKLKARLRPEGESPATPSPAEQVPAQPANTEAAAPTLRLKPRLDAATRRSIARPVLRHRMFTNFTADSEGMDTDKIVQRLLEAVAEPGEKDY